MKLNSEQRQSLEKLAAIESLIPDAIWETDDAGVFTYLSALTRDVIGYRPAEMIGKTPLDFVPVAELQERSAVFKQILIARAPFHLAAWPVVDRHGAIQFINVKGLARFDTSGALLGYSGLFHNITGRKELVAERDLLARIVEFADDAIMAKNLEGIVTSWNKGAEKIFGFTAAEIIGQPVAIMAPPDRARESAEMTARMLAGERIQHFETKRRRKDGTIVDISITCSPILDFSGKCIGTSAIARDLTQKTAMERAIALNADILLTEHELSPDEILVVTAHGKIASFNRRFADIWGLNSGTLTDAKDSDVLGAISGMLVDPDGFMTRVQSLYSHPNESSTDTFEFKDGRSFQRFSAPILARDDTHFGRVWFFHETTEEKRLEKDMRANHERVCSIIESIADFIWELDRSAVFTFVGPQCEQMFGLPPQELLHKPVFTIWPEALQEAAKIEIADRLAAGASFHLFETVHRHKSGSNIAVEVSGSPIRDERGTLIGFRGVTRDVSERKRTDAQKREYTERLSRSMYAAVEAIASTIELRDPYTAGHQRRVSLLAMTIARKLGLPEEQIEGIRIAGIVHDVGKINIPSEIPSKPGKLTAVERELLKVHPLAGYEILKGIDFPWPVAQIVLQHHERLDGGGYPNKISGHQILMGARVLTVADVTEAMMSHRPYRVGLGLDTALAEIEKNKGTAFDPAVVEACIQVFREDHFTF
jgi:PAS domain S-box-containing protein